VTVGTQRAWQLKAETRREILPALLCRNCKVEITSRQAASETSSHSEAKRAQAGALSVAGVTTDLDLLSIDELDQMATMSE